ncbi:Transcription factor tau 55 kDa subunit [Escovopsis weberi]|uniref:Transcription factor tau 55 kDa subunit n=1 Tax=Escovopsis weberi TaxID=150374 RepID=A0A0M8MQF7_ESCWE|nr:Transcription factor tau 55 kDa subunit [Escovopsis weberi]
MSLEKIYVVRHGFRTSWSVDHLTGTYSSSIPSPTGIPVDPALTAHGVEQAGELALHLARLDPPVGVVYSSPYYRCLQTIAPFARLAAEVEQPQPELQPEPEAEEGRQGRRQGAAARIRPEHGLCEWFGAAPFAHPGPAPPEVLRAMFPAWDDSYQTLARPPARGETMAQLRRRVEDTVAGIVARCDADGARSAVLCTHAAVVIMLGRQQLQGTQTSTSTPSPAA